MQLSPDKSRQPTPINRAAEFCTLSERMNDSSDDTQFVIMKSTSEQRRSL